MEAFEIPGVPGRFNWHNTPVEWSLDPSRGLLIVAGPQTDWFYDPAGGYSADTAPCALSTVQDANFLLSTRISVKFASAYDAGVIQIRAADNMWAKFCYEYSPQGHPTIVSVVTRDVSDDCNSVEIDDTQVYLRVARTPQTLAFHYSRDGNVWHLVRYFTLGMFSSLQIGFSAQSPTGTLCTAVFSEMNYRPGSLKDLRSGE